MGIEQSIKDLALSNGMDLCGIAPISRFEGAPEGMHPVEFLPGCKSVISVGVRLLDGAVQTIFRNFEDGKAAAQNIYGAYGYTIAPNFHLFSAVYNIALFIERKTRAVATPTQVGPLQGGISISQRHAAVAAGIAEFGWHGLALTPGFGPRNRFGAVLTTAELVPDPMSRGPALCNPEKCGICTSVCPGRALSSYGEKEARHITYRDEDGDRSFDVCHVNTTRCRIAIHGLMKRVGGATDLVTSLDASPGEVSAAVATIRDPYGLQDAPTWRCGKCLAYCPVGQWKEKFRDKRLSKRLPVAR